MMTLGSIHVRDMLAISLVRVFLGLLFFLQGYDKVFRLKVKNVVQEIHAPLATKGIHELFSTIGAYITSYIELICGATLILGFVTYWSLYLLGFDMLIVALAFGIVEPVWDLRHIFPRLALLVFLLITPSQWEVVSVDYAWSLFKFFKSI